MPDLPSLREARTSWVLLPIEDTTPMPVTTTRLMQDLASHCRAVVSPTWGAGQSAVASASRRGGSLLPRHEQADLEVGGGVHHLAVSLHDPVCDRQLELAQDHALQVDHILQHFGGGCDHANELQLADAEGASLAGGAEPAQEEARELPQRVQRQAARHHGVTLEVAGENPL